MSSEQYQTLEKPVLVDLLVARDRELDNLRRLIHNNNKKTYGSKSEKLSPDQIGLSFEQITPSELPVEKEVVVTSYTRTERKGRQPFPANLPREEVIYEPTEITCSCCQAELVKIGEVRTEELEKIPASLKVIEHVRIKKACPKCKEAGVLIAPLPLSVCPLERSRPGAGLLADIIVSKYVDHLPLHRQEQIFLRQGIELSRKRMCDWVAKTAELLTPVYEELKKQVLSHSYIQGDETTIKIQDGVIPQKCHTGYLWGFHGPPNLIFFHYAESRSGEVPKEILKDYQGIIQTDCYAGYNPVLVPNKCQRIACLAHVRRKFVETVQTKETDSVLKLIAEIYHSEKQCRSPEARFTVRNEKTKKLFDKLFDFLTAISAKTLPETSLAKAINYAVKQKTEIYRILDNGSFQLDNNAIERLIRPIAVGRKNYLFAGSHNGAKSAAIIYSLLGTAKLNNVQPWYWLQDNIKAVYKRGITPADLLPLRNKSTL